MTYDLHGTWESKTENHAPLTGASDGVDVSYCVNFLLAKGISKAKLIVGIPAYGLAFTLVNANSAGVGAPSLQGSSPSPASMKFNEICLKTNSGSFNYRWDDTRVGPYAFSGTYWIGYDDVRSVTLKANYIKQNDLGGAMFWDLDNDDYNNRCGFGNYPLISTVFNIVVGGSIVSIYVYF